MDTSCHRRRKYAVDPFIESARVNTRTVGEPEDRNTRRYHARLLQRNRRLIRVRSDVVDLMIPGGSLERCQKWMYRASWRGGNLSFSRSRALSLSISPSPSLSPSHTHQTKWSDNMCYSVQYRLCHTQSLALALSRSLSQTGRGV